LLQAMQVPQLELPQQTLSTQNPETHSISSGWAGSRCVKAPPWLSRYEGTRA
jgi:hypothetical protein